MKVSGKQEGTYTHYTARAELDDDIPGMFGYYGDELYLGCTSAVADGITLQLRVIMFSETLVDGVRYQYLPGFIAEERAVARLFERAAEWYAWVLRTAITGSM